MNAVKKKEFSLVSTKKQKGKVVILSVLRNRRFLNDTEEEKLEKLDDQLYDVFCQLTASNKSNLK